MLGVRVRVVLAVALAFLAAASCSDGDSPSTGPTKPRKNDISGLIVSGAYTARAGAGAAASGTAAYVSIPPASVPGGVTATASNAATGVSTTVAMVDGGFDPMPIAANIGDTLLVTVHGANGNTVAVGYQLVSANRAPKVVRTSPPKGKADVPLNAIVVVVFSAPMDSGSLLGAITLQVGGTAVVGNVAIPPNGGDILSATFTPSAPLAPVTDYVIVVSSTARDRSGNFLDGPVNSDFTTGAPGLSASILTPAAGDTIPGDYATFKLQLSSDAGLRLFSVLTDALGDWNETEGSEGILDSELGTEKYSLFSKAAPGTLSFEFTVADSLGRSATSAPVTVTVAIPDTTPRIIVRSASVLEIFAGFSGTDSAWEYVPQAVVADSPGHGGLRIIGFELLGIPGLPNPIPRCFADAFFVPDDVDTPLFREVYGDYEVTIFARDYHRSTGGVAPARLTYSDMAGHIYATDIAAPIVPGSLPTTYTGGSGHWRPPGPWLNASGAVRALRVRIPGPTAAADGAHDRTARSARALAPR